MYMYMYVLGMYVDVYNTTLLIIPRACARGKVIGCIVVVVVVVVVVRVMDTKSPNVEI